MRCLGRTGTAVVLAALLVGGCNAPKRPKGEDPFGHTQSGHDRGLPRVKGSGTIVAIDEVRRTIIIRHAGIPRLNIPAGETLFPYRDDLPGGTAAGDNVSFEIELKTGRPEVIGLGSPIAG
ncbi:copper-binding protein [Sphingomonas sp. ID1715]|uniref:copper-binding protein n=1 Tax=Sphingomonas sp. ID1715 TaxID=1656898 RepID=UPI0020C45EA7|nr:copper-binding protein [Sphingomonas sp. ID1715]